LPKPDEPKGVEAAIREGLELFIRNLIEALDGAAVLARELREPHVSALGNHDYVRHPLLIGAESLILDVAGVGGGKVGDFGMVGVAEGSVPAMRIAGVEAHPDADFFFLEDIGGEQDFSEVFSQVFGPVFANPRKLAAEGIRRGLHGGNEEFEEIAAAHAGCGARGEVAAELGGDFFVGCALGEPGVVVELAEGTKSWILVSEPQEHEL